MLREPLSAVLTCCVLAACAGGTPDAESPSPPWIEIVGERQALIVDLDSDGSLDTVTVSDDGRVRIGSRSVGGEENLGAEESSFYLSAVVDLNSDGISDLVVMAASQSGYVPQFVISTLSGPQELRLGAGFEAPEIGYGNVVVPGDAQYDCDVLALAQPKFVEAASGGTRILLAVNPPPPNVRVEDPCEGFPRVGARVTGDSLILESR